MNYALVTGTDHGLGLALTDCLLARGYFVIACRFNPEETLIDKRIKAHAQQLKILDLDIRNDECVRAMKEQVSAAVPCLDLLINNVGILGNMDKNLGDDLDFDEILQVINVNAVGTLRVTNALADLVMKSTQKTIVNISSEAGSIGSCFRTGWFGYCMSKAANNMQSALVYNNIKSDGGRLIVMHPGHVATYMRGHLDTTASISPEDSAQSILHTVLDACPAAEDKPLYLDYSGHRLPW